MNLEETKKLLVRLSLLYWLLVVVVFLAAGEQFHQTYVSTDSMSPVSVVGEFIDGDVLTQRINAPADLLESISLRGATFGRVNSGLLHVDVQNVDGTSVAIGVKDISEFNNGGFTEIGLEQIVPVSVGDGLIVSLTTTGCNAGNSIALYWGNVISAGKFDIAQDIPEDELFCHNGQPGTGRICLILDGYKSIEFYKSYWLIVVGIYAVAALYTANGIHKFKKGQNSYFAAFFTLLSKYRFLLHQLVSRDFKIKYKRSVLGVAWSFLNPLMTMTVQYLVFSTLFKSDMPNYPVYLLTGVVFFSFFSEAISSGMVSITSNASLIKKVYMPRYIFPFSKLFSSLINFSFSLIPLMLVMLITGTPFKVSLILLVFDVICFMGFVLGMIMILSTAMVFFQDTQFLWGVACMMWNFLTPIFYPESIIPSEYLTLYRMNPLYQYITFARTCIIDGISPEPMSYLWCILSSMIVLIIGLHLFKKNQDKFVLYL